MGTKNLYENGSNPFFYFGTKNLVRVRPFPILLFIFVISASFFGRAYTSKRLFCLSHMLI